VFRRNIPVALVGLAIAGAAFTAHLISTIVQPDTAGRAATATQIGLYRAQVVGELAQGGVVVLTLLLAAAILVRLGD